MKTICSLALVFCAVSMASAQTLSNYQHTVTNQGPTTYFTLDNSLVDSVTGTVSLTAVGLGGFTFDTYRNASKSYYYSATTDALYNNSTVLINGGGTTNTTSTASGSITFLFRTLDPGANTGQRYLFSAGYTTANGNAFALFIENNNVANGDPNSLKLRFGNTTTTILQATNIVPDTWYYVAITYLESRSPNKAYYYIGRPGEALTTGMTTNSSSAVAGEGISLVLGNRDTFSTGFYNPGAGQLDEFAIWNRELSVEEINAQFANLPNRIPPPLTGYQTIVTNQSPNYYFKLDNTLDNAMGGTPVLTVNGTTGGFTNDYFGNTANARYFINGADAVYVNSNLLDGGGTPTTTPGTGKGSISFIFRSLAGTNVSGQRFLFSAGGNTGTNNGFGMFMENWTSGTNTEFASLKVRFGNASKTILYRTNLVYSDWYYFAMTYDESLASKQVNWWLAQPGAPLNSGTFDYATNSLAGQGNIFIIGNHTNFNARWASPGNGAIDEFAIWHRLLSADEVTAQFNALAPVVAARPTLSITLSGSDVLLTWPASTPAGYALEATSSLPNSNPTWTPAGSPVLIGDQNVVTNASSGTTFYRLRKP
jgi:hypothetical protein